MVIYNISLLVIFATLFQVENLRLKTTHSLNSLSMDRFHTWSLTIALFSMAGVPPFFGFFSKLFVFLLLASSPLFILFPVFFILLFVGLYFYVQNIRFLNSSKPSHSSPIFEKGARKVQLYYYIVLTALFFLVFGLAFADDVLLLVR